MTRTKSWLKLPDTLSQAVTCTPFAEYFLFASSNDVFRGLAMWLVVGPQIMVITLNRMDIDPLVMRVLVVNSCVPFVGLGLIPFVCASSCFPFAGFSLLPFVLFSPW